MRDTKRQWLVRALAGGLVGAALLLAFEYVWDAMPWFGHDWRFGNPFQVWADWFRYGDFLPFPPANLCLCFLMGAEAGIATLPFADSGRELVARSLIHFVITAATVSVWVGLNFGWHGTLPAFLIPLALVYLLVWLGRWVGWYAEVAAIREKLGLAPGPSPLHWKETLPYLGFALLLCDVLPAVLRVFDARDVPVLVGLLLPYLLLPVGGFMSGLSLGRRHGFCPLYPAACGLFFVPTVFLLMNCTALPHCLMAAVPALAGNLAGAARHKMKKGAQNHEKTDPSL